MINKFKQVLFYTKLQLECVFFENNNYIFHNILYPYHAVFQIIKGSVRF